MTLGSLTFDFASPDVEGPKFWDVVGRLRQAGPLVWVVNDGGFWVATSHEVILRIAQDWQTFTSTEGVALKRPSFEAMPHLVPIELDPPRHRSFRKQVNPSMTPMSVAGLEPSIRLIADELIDEFVAAGSCDIVTDFARKFPGTVYFRLVVHCGDDDFRAVEPAARVISFESNDAERFAAAAATIREWAATLLRSRTGGQETTDVVSAIKHLNSSDDDDGTDEPFTDHEVASGLQVVTQGGIGTSANAIGTVMHVLCADQKLQERVRADPSLIRGLIEECLRLEAPVPLIFRTARHDVEIDGQRIRQGDKVCLVFGAAGRDPDVFDRPDEVDLDRPHYRHLTFGAGVHRCIGSNLARLQVRVAVEQLMARLSPFRIPPGGEVTYFSMQARGPSSIPLEFTPAERG